MASAPPSPEAVRVSDTEDAEADGKNVSSGGLAVETEGQADAAANKEFLKSFWTEQQAIREGLDTTAASAASQQPSWVNEQFDILLRRLQASESAFTCIASELPRYDLQRCREGIRQLEADLARRREELAPRKKFSFRRRGGGEPGSTVSQTTVATAPTAPAAASELAPAEASSAGVHASAAEVGPRGVASNHATSASFAGELFEGLSDAVVIRCDGEVDGRDVTLRSLRNCRVLLLDRIGALHCHDLESCELVLGAVGSSALLYGCRDCSLTMATKQLRLHDSERIAMHLRTLSGPVVERCRRILVAPFDLRYPGVEAHVAAASLGCLGLGVGDAVGPSGDDSHFGSGSDVVGGAWSDVQDFNWHKRQASPNWRLVPAGPLRRSRLEVSASGELLPPSVAETVATIFERCSSLWESVVAEEEGR
eukprot:TRINITY_DN28938_c0_g1_i1.p1 TRINITY_DN28938_c0_g1~~TRINITY_DN28938_c0_g1_i1.p1  ORF type:complete len:425 (+),score=92.46 TRINITY_DN28938_c0_g1_i1:61-1335(+)